MESLFDMPPCSTWQRTWCACVRRSARESRSWHLRRGSSTTRRTAFTRCFRRMPTASTGSMYPGSSSMSSIPSRSFFSSQRPGRIRRASATRHTRRRWTSSRGGRLILPFTRLSTRQARARTGRIRKSGKRRIHCLASRSGSTRSWLRANLRGRIQEKRTLSGSSA